MMKYPPNAVKNMEEEYKRLDDSFSGIWGAMYRSPERDEILSHILQAKIKLNQLLEENKQ
jgi:hypothetical protein